MAMDLKKAIETLQGLCKRLHMPWGEARRLGKISWEEASRIAKVAVEKLNRVHVALSSDPAPVDDGWVVIDEDAYEVADDDTLSDNEASWGWAEVSTYLRPARDSSAEND